MSVAIMTSPGSTGIDEPPGMQALSLRPSRMPPGHLEQLRERRAQPHLVVAGARDVARDREDLRAAVVRPAEIEERLAAVADDPRHRGERLGVVDRRRLAVEAEARRERRLEARLALLAFERLEQRRLLAADVGAVAVVVEEVEAEVRAQDVVAEESGVVRLGDAPPRSARRSPRSRRGRSCSRARSPSRRRRSPCPRSARAGCSAGCRGP